MTMNGAGASSTSSCNRCLRSLRTGPGHTRMLNRLRRADAIKARLADAVRFASTSPRTLPGQRWCEAQVPFSTYQAKDGIATGTHGRCKARRQFGTSTGNQQSSEDGVWSEYLTTRI